MIKKILFGCVALLILGALGKDVFAAGTIRWEEGSGQAPKVTVGHLGEGAGAAIVNIDGFDPEMIVMAYDAPENGTDPESSEHNTFRYQIGWGIHKVKKRVNPGKKHTKKQAIQVLDEITIFLMREKTQIPRNLRCHYYSSFCLAAGEYAGLDLEPFFIPTRGYKQAHMLLRCATSDNELFLYDPAFGGEKDIVFYQKYFNLAECNAYPKVLNEEEFDAAQLSNIGVTWHNKGKYEKAAEFYVQALESDPDYAPAHNNLGVAYAKLGRYDEAIACYKEALNIDSDYSAALNNLAIAFYRMSKFDQAIEFFDKAIKANPKNTGAYNNKGLMLQKIGRKKEAFECFSRVVELKQKIK